MTPGGPHRQDMPHFLHAEGGYYLSTNLKVMFSTLSAQSGLRRVEGRALRSHVLAQRIPLVRPRPHYLVVRDPFARLASFYRDKVLQDPRVRGPFPYDGWQDCQRLLFPHIGVTPVDPPHAIADRLGTVPFERFLEVLPSIYRRDAHLTPQADVRWVRIVGPGRLALRFDRVFRMERRDDMDALAALGLDLGIRAASTEAVDFTPRWPPEQRALVARLYHEDVQLLGAIS